MFKKKSEVETWAEYSAPRLAEMIVSDLWREKEIWQGRIGSAPYDPETYEKYGRALLLMGDKIEAGKYLFLSGRRTPEYEQAIEFYLRRHSRGSWQLLLSTFPKRAKNLRFEDFPKTVQIEFMRLKMPADYGRENLTITALPKKSSDRWALLCCSFAVLFFGSCFVAGFYVLFLQWLF